MATHHTLRPLTDHSNNHRPLQTLTDHNGHSLTTADTHCTLWPLTAHCGQKLTAHPQDTHSTRMDARKKQKSTKAAMAEEMAVVQAAKVAEANRWVCE